MKVGIHKFRDYLILGDDVAIFEKVVYDEFLRTARSLGIEVNLDKSTVSTRSAEIAKRFFVDGEDITGVPLD